MRIWIGWLILLPFAGAWWLTIKIVDACIKKGGSVRMLGVIVSFFVGGGSILAGYFIGPIAGWFIMAVGGLVVVIGTWRSIVMTKTRVEHEELEELQRKQWEGKPLGKLEQDKWEDMWTSAKQQAKRMLEQDKIDDYERFSLVSSTLLKHGNDSESYDLYSELRELAWKVAIEEAKRILEQGKIGIQKVGRERFGWICYGLSDHCGGSLVPGSRYCRDHESAELLKRLRELKNS